MNRMQHNQQGVMGPPTPQSMSMQQQLMQTVRSPPPNRSPQSNPSPRAQPSASPRAQPSPHLPSHSPAPQMGANQQPSNADMHMHPHQSPISNMPPDNMNVPGGNMNVQGMFRTTFPFCNAFLTISFDFHILNRRYGQYSSDDSSRSTNQIRRTIVVIFRILLPINMHCVRIWCTTYAFNSTFSQIYNLSQMKREITWIYIISTSSADAKLLTKQKANT